MHLRPSAWPAILALAALPLLAGCGDETELLPPDVATTPGCNPLGSTNACLYPFPNLFFTRDDPTSPTGRRLNLDPDKLPKKDGLVPLDVTPYNQADGFSPVGPILVHFGVNVDTTKGLADEQHPERSLIQGSPVAVFDLETGKRVLHMVEMDLNVVSDADGRYAFIIRPLEPMAMGHRHLVVLTNELRDEAGRALEPSPAFRALRDATRTTNKQIEALRPRYDELFTFTDKQGYGRNDLLLAWEIPIASEDYLLGSVLSMREQALKENGTKGLPYKITEVQVDPNPEMARIVVGTFQVPTFVQADDSFAYDDKHHPIRQVMNRSYPFTMLIPKVAESAGAPLPLAILGHGIFGNGRDFLKDGGDAKAIQKLSNQYGVVCIATDWIGLSSSDLPKIAAEVAQNLDRISLITDQLQQSLINHLTLTKLARGALKDDPQVKVGPNALIDLDHTYYWGASLGGIQGSSFISISDDISRAAFGVPGSAWSTMISRSIVFPALRAFVNPHYPDPLDFLFGVALIQSRFDHSDPANLTKMMFEHPPPGSPKDRLIILQEAIGDSQVPNMATGILARALGVQQIGPYVSEVVGLQQVTSPVTTSVLAQYRLPEYDDPLPPSGNIAPDMDNGVHHAMNFLPNVHKQIAGLWFKGKVEQFCQASCDPD